MRVEALELSGYTNHRGTAILFPRRGVVVITGANGSGKSSLLEAVGWAGWGQTLRGSSPVAVEGGATCTVNLAAGGLQVSRARRGKGKTTLEWSTAGATPTVYETPTKAQEALNRELGDFDRWRRTHVFTSVDAWGFADAPDAQRKLLLEQLLGLGCFDLALERCRVDLKAAVKDASAASMAAATARVRCDEQERAVVGLEAAAGHVGPIGDIAALEVQVARLYSLAQVADDELQGFVREDQVARAAETDARLESGHLEKRQRALAGHSTCPVCEQALPEGLIHGLQRSMSEAIRVAEQRATERAQRATDSAAAVAELREEAATLRRRGAEGTAAIQAARTAREQAERHAAGLKAARDRLAESRAQGAALDAKQMETAGRQATLEVVEKVLGLRGVRATVLDGALRAVEDVANVWLARLGLAGLGLTLAMVDDKVALDIRGAGGGYGYAGASAGERRRVALALMLALAEIAQASGGGSPGTLWMDEVFDVLDRSGVEAAATVIMELAEDRCVVVISHNHDVVECLRGAKRLHVENGVVTEL